MKKLLLNFLLCFAHLIFVLLGESFLAVTIIWFSDYRYSLNVGIVICLFVILGLHYFTLVQLIKQNLLYRRSLDGLLFFDLLACLASCLVWTGFCLYLKTMPYIQIIFIIVINLAIILSRIIAAKYLRNVR